MRSYGLESHCFLHSEICLSSSYLCLSCVCHFWASDLIGPAIHAPAPRRIEQRATWMYFTQGFAESWGAQVSVGRAWIWSVWNLTRPRLPIGLASASFVMIFSMPHDWSHLFGGPSNLGWEQKSDFLLGLIWLSGQLRDRRGGQQLLAKCHY